MRTSGSPTLRRILAAAVVALMLGFGLIGVLTGYSSMWLVSAAQQIALLVGIASVLGGAAIMIALRLADWKDPSTEAEFERVVERSERLAREGLAVDPDETDFMELDPFDDDDFDELVRDALDELPDLLQNALRHVPVVISDEGRKARAYGLYQGGTIARDDFHDRIIIFRDTLRRDFGHDSELLRAEVLRTVRHELAHHVGFDEMGVQELGL